MEKSTDREKWALKVGGSLDEEPALGALLATLGRLASRFDLVTCPGGGGFADFIRERSARKNTPDKVAHAQAVLAMAQFGHEIAARLSNGKTVVNAEGVSAAWRAGRAPVFIPYPFAVDDGLIPHTWEATSDTIAARMCHAVGVRRLVLLKSVDGVFSGGKLVAEMDAAGANEVDFVDPLFAGHIEREWDVYVINGRKPERLEELLVSGKLTGTRITRRF